MLTDPMSVPAQSQPHAVDPAFECSPFDTIETADFAEDTDNGTRASTRADSSSSNVPTQASHLEDPVFQKEQAHLTETHAALRQLAVSLARKMEKTQRDAAETKKDMAGEASLNFVGDDEALETYAQIAAMNRIIDGYNIAQSADAEKLSNVQLLLRQPYFAKVVLQFKPDEEPKELYIGNAGVSDEDCRRMVVDWRSPVAETYYNQENG
ncbi:MAG: hypothetical protein IJC51_01725, partial [Eggerthellaceae bacterium]|nr:hypothetical protein [Eggerthellaceae bacterium]